MQQEGAAVAPGIPEHHRSGLRGVLRPSERQNFEIVQKPFVLRGPGQNGAAVVRDMVDMV
jgi:hypothetical protein